MNSHFIFFTIIILETLRIFYLITLILNNMQSISVKSSQNYMSPIHRFLPIIECHVNSVTVVKSNQLRQTLLKQKRKN